MPLPRREYELLRHPQPDRERRSTARGGAVLLAEADEAELMSEDACLYLSSIYDLCGTDYEDIVPLCESARYGPSADMWGTVYRFKPMPPLERHISHECPHGTGSTAAL